MSFHIHLPWETARRETFFWQGRISSVLLQQTDQPSTFLRRLSNKRQNLCIYPVCFPLSEMVHLPLGFTLRGHSALIISIKEQNSEQSLTSQHSSVMVRINAERASRSYERKRHEFCTVPCTKYDGRHRSVRNGSTIARVGANFAINKRHQEVHFQES